MLETPQMFAYDSTVSPDPQARDRRNIIASLTSDICLDPSAALAILDEALRYADIAPGPHTLRASDGHPAFAHNLAKALEFNALSYVGYKGLTSPNPNRHAEQATRVMNYNRHNSEETRQVVRLGSLALYVHAVATSKVAGQSRNVAS